MQSQSRRRVALVVRAIPQYRGSFYNLLRERLAQEGVELTLIYGQASPRRALRMDLVDIPWATRIRNVVIRIGDRELYWQPCMRQVKGCDLVIVIQEAKLLVNYVLLVQRILAGRRLAFWGHGRNWQVESRFAPAEWAKAWMSRRVDWWFAYTDNTLAVLKSLGFPEHRTTVVQNAIDTRDLRALKADMDPAWLSDLRRNLHIGSENVCLFAGSVYREKRLEFLLQACTQVRERIPDFEIIILGAGPGAELADTAAREHEWIHFVGAKFGAEKVPYFGLAKLLLIPGAVGLAILDAFALEVPLVTTSHPSHGPEIAYLVSGQNGVMVEDPDDPGLYAERVVELLRDSALLQKLREGCREAARFYTIERMVDNFVDGILRCLSANVTGVSG